MASNSFINLQGKVVIITGASAGIGEATAQECARQGCQLMLHGRDTGRLQAVSAACRQLGGQNITVQTTAGDITDPAVQKEIIEETLSAFGKIDILVNNAGMMINRDPLTATREVYKQIMDTNLESVFFLTQLAIPHLIKSKGNVVNVSSIVSHTVMAPHGVRVNSVNPGSVVSLIYKRGQEALSDQQYEEFQQRQASPSVHPLGRMVLASEVADSIVFLASERASFITGQIIFVDGGRHCLGPVPQLK
ncbi:unnamed protein product [Candidula unifasciata]|uniref:Uncharacterized protein n=1 Tax=Candidula unifasciata TaxID=100452 RepID=A0A8S3Z112_9EUPU|nr:unnamed protein product [Candidula unifasciata]